MPWSHLGVGDGFSQFQAWCTTNSFFPFFQVTLQSVFWRRVRFKQGTILKNQWVSKQLLGLGW